MGVPQPLVLCQHLGILPSSLVREAPCLVLSELLAWGRSLNGSVRFQEASESGLLCSWRRLPFLEGLTQRCLGCAGGSESSHGLSVLLFSYRTVKTSSTSGGGSVPVQPPSGALCSAAAAPPSACLGSAWQTFPVIPQPVTPPQAGLIRTPPVLWEAFPMGIEPLMTRV